MTYETLRFDVVDGVATITLHRPDSANSLNQTMAEELDAVSIVCDEDSDVRAVLIRGDERFFCAGGDLTTFNVPDDQIKSTIKAMADRLHSAVIRLSKLRAPTVVAVAGTAAGAGFSIAASADLIVAGKSTKFVIAYTAAGLTPDGSSTYFLPRRIGVSRTKELMLTNRILTADEALDWGLVNRVVDDADVIDASLELARMLAAGPTSAFAAVNRLLESSFSNDIETQLDLETLSIAEAAATVDGREGVQAFLEKRRPRFTGK